MWLSWSSVREEQSVQQSYSFNIDKINGFWFAFNAKYSRNPLFHEKAILTFSAFSRIIIYIYKFFE